MPCPNLQDATGSESPSRVRGLKDSLIRQEEHEPDGEHVRPGAKHPSDLTALRDRVELEIGEASEFAE